MRVIERAYLLYFGSYKKTCGDQPLSINSPEEQTQIDQLFAFLLGKANKQLNWATEKYEQETIGGSVRRQEDGCLPQILGIYEERQAKMPLLAKVGAAILHKLSADRRPAQSAVPYKDAK